LKIPINYSSLGAIFCDEGSHVCPRQKKSGSHEYLQIVENRRVEGRVAQRVIATVGRLDRLKATGDIEGLVRSLAKYSEKVLLILSGIGDAVPNAAKIGWALIFEPRPRGR
jgi:hypothetical protein